MELTKTDAIFKHRILWSHIGYLLENATDRGISAIIEDEVADSYKTAKLKIKMLKLYFPMLPVPDEIRNYCFICDYAYKTTLYSPAPYFSNDIGICVCDNCPLQNMQYSTGNGCLDGLYGHFVDAYTSGNFASASKIAYKIAYKKECK